MYRMSGMRTRNRADHSIYDESEDPPPGEEEDLYGVEDDEDDPPEDHPEEVDEDQSLQNSTPVSHVGGSRMRNVYQDNQYSVSTAGGQQVTPENNTQASSAADTNTRYYIQEERNLANTRKVTHWVRHSLFHKVKFIRNDKALVNWRSDRSLGSYVMKELDIVEPRKDSFWAVYHKDVKEHLYQRRNDVNAIVKRAFIGKITRGHLVQCGTDST